MFNRTAENFIRKHHLEGLERLRRLANEGASLRVIADTFDVPLSTAGRLTQVLLKKVYYISDATEDWLRYCEQRHQFIAERHHGAIERGAHEPHLTLIDANGRRAQ